MVRLGADGIEWIVDDSEAQKALRLMVRNVQDFRPFWGPIEDAILESNAKRFDSRDGGKWPGWSPAYAKWRAVHGGRSLLELSGTLRASLTEKGATGQRWRRGQRELFFESLVRTPDGQSLTHITNAGHGKQPARRLINVNEPYLRKALGDAAGEVAKQWAREWRGS